MCRLCSTAHAYFHSLYNPGHIPTPLDLSKHRSGQLLQSELFAAKQLPSSTDIKGAMFSIGTYKAPSYDGLPAHFYQMYWEFCKVDVERTIWECYHTASVPLWMNLTLITLVPEQANVKHLS